MKTIVGIVLVSVLAAGFAGLTPAYAKKAMTTLQENDDSIAKEYMAASFAAKNNDYALAAALFAKAVVKQPDDPLLLENTYKFMLLAGNYQEAVRYARQYIRYDTESMPAKLLIAIDAASKGEYPRASGMVSELMQDQGRGRILSIEQLFMPFIRVWLIAAEGNMDVALGALNPDDLQGIVSNAFLRLQKALLYSVAGKHKKAGELFKDLQDAKGVMPYNLAKAAAGFYESQGMWNEAKGIYDLYRQQHPSAPHFENAGSRIQQRISDGLYVSTPVDGLTEVLKEAARLLFSNGVYDNGLAYLRLALMLKPDDLESLVLLASTQEEFGNIPEAIRLYDQVPEGSDMYWSVQINKAEALYKNGEKSKARRLLLKVAKNIQETYIPLVTLGDLMRRDNEYADAIKIYTRVLKSIDTSKPESWAVFFARGICYERNKQWPDAEADFLKALELHPNQPEVMNYLAYSWVDKDMHLQRATNMLLKAAAARPDDPQILDSAGWALYKSGDYKNAALFLEKATKALPQDAIMNDHLGDIYWKQGRKYEAKYQWQHALKYAESEPHLLEPLKQKIEKGLVD